MLRLSNQQRLQIEAAANTLCINARPAFYRAVAGKLETAPQPISTNDVLYTVQMALEFVPPKDVLTRRSLGPIPEEFETDFRRRL